MARLSSRAFLKLAPSTCEVHIGLVALPPVTSPSLTEPLSLGLTVATLPGFTVMACGVAELAQPVSCRTTAAPAAAHSNFRNLISSLLYGVVETVVETGAVEIGAVDTACGG